MTTAPPTTSSSTTRAVPTASAEQVGELRDFLARHLRVAAGNPQDPWALAHGLLAFGKDHRSRDGRGAVALIFSHARRDPEDGHVRFEGMLGDRPVEPHPHMMARALLLSGVDPDHGYAIAYAQQATLRDLVDTATADARLPGDDHGWHTSAWWLDTIAWLAVHDQPRVLPAGLQPEVLRDAALDRLRADLAVVEGATVGPGAFAPGKPIGAAKRRKTHIYGHACGGLHFVQAVMRLTQAYPAPAAQKSVAKQLARLHTRARAEGALYRSIIARHPEAALPISAQQLKFFGHLLELVIWLPASGLLVSPEQETMVTDLRKLALRELVAAGAQLRSAQAYERLDRLAATRPQLALDLVGDGCHALRALSSL